MVAPQTSAREEESLLSSNRSDVLDNSHNRRQHGSLFSHAGDDDGPTRAEDLPTHHTAGTPKKPTLGQFLFKAFCAFFICVVYMTNGFTVGFASFIPSVQFDFTQGTTQEDMFNPQTLAFRSGVGKTKRTKGGLSFCKEGPDKDDKSAGAAWNTYTKKDWTTAAPRVWFGWIRPAPAMSTIGLVPRVNGEADVTLTIFKDETQNDKLKEITIKGVKATSVPDLSSDKSMKKAYVSGMIKDLDISNSVYFKLQTTFRPGSNVQLATNEIELLYYLEGDKNYLRPAVLPFAEFVDGKQLNTIAGSEEYIEKKFTTADAHEVNMKNPKGQKFICHGIVLLVWASFALFAFLICVGSDIFGMTDKAANGGKSLTKMCFEWKNIFLIAPAAIMWGIADIFECLALGGLDPTIYGVLTQSRIILTALLASVMINKKFTPLQWIILIVLTFLVTTFAVSKGGSGGGTDTLALVACGIKQFLSVTAGVYGEKYLKGVDRPFAVQL